MPERKQSIFDEGFHAAYKLLIALLLFLGICLLALLCVIGAFNAYKQIPDKKPAPHKSSLTLPIDPKTVFLYQV